MVTLHEKNSNWWYDINKNGKGHEIGIFSSMKVIVGNLIAKYWKENGDSVLETKILYFEVGK